jgi:hypothetical protein
MNPSVATANTVTAIWSRILDVEHGDWSPEMARGMLSITLSDADRERMNELAEKAAAQVLTPDEEIDIESYRQVSRLLELMKVKARIALKRADLDF